MNRKREIIIFLIAALISAAALIIAFIPFGVDPRFIGTADYLRLFIKETLFTTAACFRNCHMCNNHCRFRFCFTHSRQQKAVLSFNNSAFVYNDNDVFYRLRRKRPADFVCLVILYFHPGGIYMLAY